MSREVKNMEAQFKKLIIDVRVHDLNRALNFYKDVLGLPLIRKESDWASLNAVGAEIHLYLHGGTKYGIEFRVSDIEMVVEKLKSKGVKFHVESDHDGLLDISGEIMQFSWGKSAHFEDFEGNYLALVED